jgi:CCR4-NOT transcription complex subunit 3
MAEKRKLLAEIEKVFRKVEEGVDLFEEIMSKMGEASSDNQRDKLQDDLKKEIKKLQRLRDQIKGWQNSNEIKDKESLIKFRKLIEQVRCTRASARHACILQRMEQFKDIERENKTKPHSKQGLLIEDKIDPKTREKAEALEYLSVSG